jgi:hypothetical protein
MAQNTIPFERRYFLGRFYFMDGNQILSEACRSRVAAEAEFVACMEAAKKIKLVALIHNDMGESK